MATKWFRLRLACPAVGALGVAPLLSLSNCTACDEVPFVTYTCVKTEQHTHNTKKITFQPGVLGDLVLGKSWTEKGAVANMLVRATVQGAREAGCCACCKCTPPCGCPKTANGCCACCSCPDICGCPKVVSSTSETKAERDSSEVVRPYNPLSCETDGTVTLLVKRYEDSKMGTTLHNLKPGETIEMRGPNQQWSLEPGKYSKYNMIAGGTGITPLIQATQHILKHDKGASVVILTLNSTPSDSLLVQELADMANRYQGRLTVIHETGEPTAAMLKKSLTAPGNRVMVMVCGRPQMTSFIAGPKGPNYSQGAIGGLLKKLGYSSKEVWKL